MTEERDTSQEETVTAEKSKFQIPDTTQGWALVERIGWHLLDKKGEDILALDLRGRSDVCDFFVIASGNSETQVKALSKHLHDCLVDGGHKPAGLEGLNDGRWALLDLFDVVVHVFHQESREYFQLERLWGDAPKLELNPKHYTDADVQARNADLNFNTAADLDGAE